MGSIDWVKIRNEYICSGISQRELANKYNLSLSTLSKRAKKEDWVGKRQVQQNKTAAKMRQKSKDAQVEKRLTQLERLSRLTDKLIDKVELAMEQLDKYVLMETTSTVKDEKLKKGTKRTTKRSQKIKEVNSRVIDRKGLQELSSTMKNIKDILSVTNGDDEEGGSGVIEIAAVLEPPPDEDDRETVAEGGEDE
ncbi:MAG: hypothetical protein IJ410_03510 [Oscillospiraceae bacterium]|nr:hypothetical protein [Oscillospiraceae bacterium]